MAWFASVPLVSACELLDQVLGEHAAATKLRAFSHYFQESVLSLLADDGYVPQVNHQRRPPVLPVGCPPCGPQLRDPGRD
jgi:hypothetical protein